MSLIYKGVPVPTLVAIGIFIFAGLFAIIGLATPNWHNEVVSSSKIQSQINAHHGLWAKCSFRGADNFDCGAHSAEKEFLIAVRAMEILAVLFGATCIILTGFWAFLKIEKFRNVMAIGYLITGFLTGLFGLIGIIIYAAEVNSFRNDDPAVLVDYQLSWSFALATIAACLTLIATACLGTVCTKSGAVYSVDQYQTGSTLFDIETLLKDQQMTFSHDKQMKS